MASLPYSRVVDVNLTRQDNFPNRAGFGVPLILSEAVSDVLTGAVDAATRVKVYGTMAEVEADWSSATGAYKMAQTIFSQNPTPSQVKIGYIDDSAPANYGAELAIIEEFDDGWYWLLPTSTGAWVDSLAEAKALADWVETRSKLMILPTFDANTENPTDTTSIAAQMKELYSRSAAAYHDVAETNLHAGIAAYGATRNFDDIGSAYTMKFKQMTTIPVVDKGSSAIQAVTGFVPALGLQADQGHFANTYVNIGGADFVVEGQMLDGGFIDEVHFQDWLIARTQEELLGVFTTTPRIEYSDKGINLLVQSVQRVLSRAQNAGLIIPYEDANGDIRNWDIRVPRVASLAASQRRQRIAPAISATFRYAGAVHYATVNYTMTF